MKLFCKKRNIRFIVGDTPEDFCVDCKFFDNGECWVSELPVKYVENEPIQIIRPSAKILDFNPGRNETPPPQT